jgi:hypothetical protein
VPKWTRTRQEKQAAARVEGTACFVRGAATPKRKKLMRQAHLGRGLSQGHASRNCSLVSCTRGTGPSHASSAAPQSRCRDTAAGNSMPQNSNMALSISCLLACKDVRFCLNGSRGRSMNTRRGLSKGYAHVYARVVTSPRASVCLFFTACVALLVWSSKVQLLASLRNLRERRSAREMSAPMNTTTLEVPPRGPRRSIRGQIVLFGDSITQRSFSVGGWGARLAHDYMRKADVLNRGFSGYNSAWGDLAVQKVR